MDVNSSPLAQRDDAHRESITSRVADFRPRKPSHKAKHSSDDENPEIALWSAAKRQSWEAIETNPNAFYYRHVAPGQRKRTGAWDESEKRLFLEALKVHPPSQGKWGLFARHIPGRVGYQCRNFYHRMLESGELDGMPEETKKKEMDDEEFVAASRKPRAVKPAPAPAPAPVPVAKQPEKEKEKEKEKVVMSEEQKSTQDVFDEFIVEDYEIKSVTEQHDACTGRGAAESEAVTLFSSKFCCDDDVGSWDECDE